MLIIFPLMPTSFWVKLELSSHSIVAREHFSAVLCKNSKLRVQLNLSRVILYVSLENKGNQKLLFRCQWFNKMLYFPLKQNTKSIHNIPNSINISINSMLMVPIGDFRVSNRIWPLLKMPNLLIFHIFKLI